MTYNGAEEITNADAPFLPAASIGQPIPLLSIVLNVQTDQDLPAATRLWFGHWHIGCLWKRASKASLPGLRLAVISPDDREASQGRLPDVR